MKTIGQRNVILMAAALILITALAACGQQPTNAKVEITEDKVAAIVQGMLNGYNEGDYADFSRDLSAGMRLVISEAAFKDFTHQSKATIGNFQSITSIEAGKSDSASSDWEVSAKFEQTAAKITFTFNQASGLIEGMDFGPQK